MFQSCGCIPSSGDNQDGPIVVKIPFMKRQLMFVNPGEAPATPPAKQVTISSDAVGGQQRGPRGAGMSAAKNQKSLFGFTMTEAFDNDDDEVASGTTSVDSDKVASVVERVEQVYPGALKSKELANSLVKVLENTVGNDASTTLLATSLCCDEVCRELEEDLCEKFGSNFSMGGLAGFAFGGVTSFGAMAHHIPINGSCLIVYGPHVGVDWDGKCGKVNRRGRNQVGSGACCGSATAAAAYCKAVNDGIEVKAPTPDDPINAQQTWVGTALLPHGSRLEEADDAAAELPHCLFECQQELMDRIYNKAKGEVATEGGKIAFLGGIQINTPEGVPEFFLPKAFELRNNKGETIQDLMNELGNVATLTEEE